jgi:hypothetical protein
MRVNTYDIHLCIGMLGVTIRFDSYHDAEEHLCRVTGG